MSEALIIFSSAVTILANIIVIALSSVIIYQGIKIIRGK